jgi:hypothetical protein
VRSADEVEKVVNKLAGGKIDPKESHHLALQSFVPKADGHCVSASTTAP